MRKMLIILPLVAAALAVLLWRELRQGGDGLILYGNVEIRQVDVAFRVDGRIAALLVDEGDAVTAGTPLARLETDRLSAQAAQAEAQLAREKANLQRLESGYRSEEIAAARAELAAARALADNARQNL